MPRVPLLYYITDRTAFAPDEPTRRRLLLDKIAEATRANIDYIQLREKDLSPRDLESLARDALTLISKLMADNTKTKTLLLINSRTDIAMAVGAGVHLRSHDVSPQDVRKIWRKHDAESRARHLPSSQPLIGVSCHSAEEVTEAESNDATFAVFGPVYEKKDVLQVQPAGLSRLRIACRGKIPVFALGGITLANARSCLDAGAAGIAAIRLFQENNIAEVADQLRSL